MLPDSDDPPLSYIVGHHLLLLTLPKALPRAVGSVSPRLGVLGF